MGAPYSPSFITCIDRGTTARIATKCWRAPMYIKCPPEGKTNGLLSDLYFYSRNFSFACFCPPQPLLLVLRCVNLCQCAISRSRSFSEKSPSSRLSRISALTPSSLFCSQPRSLPLGLLRPLPFLTLSKTFCPTGLTRAPESGVEHSS